MRGPSHRPWYGKIRRAVGRFNFPPHSTIHQLCFLCVVVLMWRISSVWRKINGMYSNWRYPDGPGKKVTFHEVRQVMNQIRMLPCLLAFTSIYREKLLQIWFMVHIKVLFQRKHAVRNKFDLNRTFLFAVVVVSPEKCIAINYCTHIIGTTYKCFYVL